MKKLKLLPIAVAVAASAMSLPSMASESDLVFSGYARYGLHIAEGDSRYVEIGSTGRSVGRLGNEVNGGEFQLTKKFVTDNGANWDIGVMIDHWQYDGWGSKGGVNLKKAYASVSNVIESQPGMSFWAGRDFHGRAAQGLNDYFWMTHDGQGGGFKDLDLGAMKMDLGVVGQVADGDNGNLGNDNGDYAVVGKLHGINAGVGNLDLYANYGFTSEEAGEEKQDDTALQVGAVLGVGSVKLTAVYSDGVGQYGYNSVFDTQEDIQILYTSIEGGFNPTAQLAVDYLASYKEFAGEDSPQRNEYSAIVRPMYKWNDVHSTWFEAGYVMEDYDSGDEATGWKATLSQNISMGGMPWSRPMLRFYATVGEVEDTSKTVNDVVSFGTMFEAWW